MPDHINRSPYYTTSYRTRPYHTTYRTTPHHISSYGTIPYHASPRIGPYHTTTDYNYVIPYQTVPQTIPDHTRSYPVSKNHIIPTTPRHITSHISSSIKESHYNDHTTPTIAFYPSKSHTITSYCKQPDPPAEINYTLGDWYPSKWGTEDRIGAVNYITPEKILSASQLVRSGKTYALAVVNSPEFPAFGDRWFHVNAYEVNLGGSTNTSYHEDEMTASIGVGTHVDGLGHIGIDGKFYNGITEEELNPNNETGIQLLGNSGMLPIVTRFVALDIAKYKGVKRLGSNEIISPSDIVGAARQQRVCIGSGDVVLLHTGWLQVWLEDRDGDSFISSEPGIGVEAAEYLAGLEVVAIGADTWGVEAYPNEVNVGTLFMAHQILLPKYGVYLIENVNVKPLLDDGHYEGMFSMGVPRLKGSVQTVVNPIAIV